MPATTHVQPGDLIRAQDVNDLIDKLEELEARIAALEAGSPVGSGPVILGFNPPQEQSINRTLEVRGANFLIPPRLNLVTLGDVPITNFEPSQTDLLRFRIPFLPRTPRNVTLRIENSRGSVSRLYRVTPEVPVAGDPPEIDDVATEEGGSTLRVGGGVVIHGSNFAAAPANNQLSISSRVAGHADEEYPITEIDVAASSPTEIHATLPDDIVIHNAASGFPDPMLLRLTVGAHDQVTRDVLVEAD